MSAQDFLFELGTEELPPKTLKTLSDALVSEIQAGLQEAGLEHGPVKGFAAPRRLAVFIESIQDHQADRPFDKRGPAVKAAFNAEGNATRAAEGFARSCGVTVDQLQTLDTDKGAYLVYQGVEPGKATTALLPGIIVTALDRLPIAKRMRWGANRYEFVRPVKWLLSLWGDQVMPFEAFGLTAGDLSYGHRVHAPDALRITQPSAYADLLKTLGWVMTDFAQRKAYIQAELDKQARQHDVVPLTPDDLMDEVTSLNEWPVVLSGQFEERFLDVPAEALISSMQEHQKYFAATDHNGQLVNRFFFVANLESRDPDVVISGNEKVIRPRLSDAAFFWESDQKMPLADRLGRLDQVVFQKQLGSVGDKSRRMASLAADIARQTGADIRTAERAALLAKADLVTDLVFEFDDLQGLAGYYYARKDGEGEAIALAIRDQYKPGFAGDALPETAEGAVVALADRLDTLTGIFGIGQKPTGTKDPFALRRASLGVLRIIMENDLDLDLRALLSLAQRQYPDTVFKQPAQALEDAQSYVLDRMRALFQDAGITPDVFLSVDALGLTQPLDIKQRVEGVNAFKHSPAADSLSAANKRVANLLSKVDGELSTETRRDKLTEPAEQALLDALEGLESRVSASVASRDYEGALALLSELKDPLDRFFDDVMVMADDEDLKHQRLALLSRIRGLFLNIADISLLQL